MTTGRTPTRDILPPKFVTLPDKCINASALRSLANALDRLHAFHRDKGGPAPDSPCLVEVHVERGTVIARVGSGDRVFKLELIRGSWEFR